MTMLLANSSGLLSAKFTIPANILSGDKRVAFMGASGSRGEAVFSSQGTTQRRVLQVDTSISETRWQSPAPADEVTPNIDSYEPVVVTPTATLTKYENGIQIIRSLSAAAAAKGFGSAQVNAEIGIAQVQAALDGGFTAVADILLGGAMGSIVNVSNFLSGSSEDGFAAGAHWTACSTTDPLAQTFSLSAAGQLAAIDLWFTGKGAEAVRVDIRTVSNGTPSSTILASAFVASADILTNGTATRVTFSAPVALLADTEYAFVVLANNAATAVSIAELGKWDASTSQFVTNQPYTVGVLLSSSNALTWTAHQDKDMAFRLLMASYTATTRTIALGTVAVTGVTDLMLMSYADKPTSAAHVDYMLTLPDLSTVTVSDGQSVRLASAITGNVAISATLHGDATSSPVLTPGTQLAYGTVATSADYITRAIPAGTTARVKVIFEAIIPSGASVAAAVKGIDGGDVWIAATYQSSIQLGNGWMEVTHELASITETSVHVKLALAGNTNARPRVRNLRVIVL